MFEAISRPISLVVAVLGAVGFLIGLGTSGLMVAFSVIGLIYLAAIPVAGIGILLEGVRWPARVAIGAGVVLFIAAAPFLVLKVAYTDLGHIGIYSIFGMVVVAFAVGLFSTAFVLEYRHNHRTCPECVNVIHTDARVCHFCGYRFKPPVPAKGE